MYCVLYIHLLPFVLFADYHKYFCLKSFVLLLSMNKKLLIFKPTSQSAEGLLHLACVCLGGCMTQIFQLPTSVNWFGKRDLDTAKCVDVVYKNVDLLE